MGKSEKRMLFVTGDLKTRADVTFIVYRLQRASAHDKVVKTSIINNSSFQNYTCTPPTLMITLHILLNHIHLIYPVHLRVML